ncbi:MAG TPA: MSHA biogenesis protein MshI [Thioalkalivibrio sp.]|nr:MSHA biogenesis protein MshI [Thioalkalivibrio sp.]
MRQEINLYRDALRPVSLILPARTMLALLAGLLLLLLLLWAGLAVRTWGAEQALAEQRERLARQQVEVSRVSEQLAQRVKSPVLEQQVQRLERELRLKRRLLAMVSGESQGNTEGFSAALAGLGRHQRDGLWLTHIAFSRGGAGLRLQGATLDARELPAYLQALAAEPAYVGREFGTFWLRRPEPAAGGRLDFVVSTHCDADDCLQEARR